MSKKDSSLYIRISSVDKERVNKVAEFLNKNVSDLVLDYVCSLADLYESDSSVSLYKLKVIESDISKVLKILS